jgi:hypothetical protein
MPSWIEKTGAKPERQRRERRHYRGGKGGNLSTTTCAGGCGLRMPTGLLAVGITAHPTCGPDAAAVMAAQR